MFDGGNWDERVDQLEDLIRVNEAEISRLRAEQVAALRQLDRNQIDSADGARTMVGSTGWWTSCGISPRLLSRICSNTATWWSNPTWTNQPSNCGDTSRATTVK